jgi:serine/threonine-protein kinase HipA
MSDFEVGIELNGGMRRVGIARSNKARGTETVTFEYADTWLSESDRFSLEPALVLGRGTFAPATGQRIFGSIGDSAPDTWGRRIMQRAERRRAEREGRAVRTLFESDYLLGVSDETRPGALRFRVDRESPYLAPSSTGVPPLLRLAQLMQATERILRDEETDEDLQLIFAPGSSLGGARPKASVLDNQGRLCIAKFPKVSDARRQSVYFAPFTVALMIRSGTATLLTTSMPLTTLPQI